MNVAPDDAAWELWEAGSRRAGSLGGGRSSAAPVVVGRAAAGRAAGAGRARGGPGRGRRLGLGLMPAALRPPGPPAGAAALRGEPGAHQGIATPPFGRRIWPVMKAEASRRQVEHGARATSSGTPTRPSGRGPHDGLLGAGSRPFAVPRRSWAYGPSRGRPR